MTNGCDPYLVADLERLRDACISLRVLSNEFKLLFSDEDKPTLDAAGSAVFQVIHDSMIETWWMRAGRLLDPAGSGDRENLSFQNILKRLQRVKGADQGVEVARNSLPAIWAKMKPARDKQVAHADLAASRQGVWLGTITESDGEEFQDGLQELCDLIGNKLGVGPLDFGSSACKGDATDLVAFLKFGLRARNAWQKQNGNETSFRGMYRD